MKTLWPCESSVREKRMSVPFSVRQGRREGRRRRAAVMLRSKGWKKTRSKASVEKKAVFWWTKWPAARQNNMSVVNEMIDVRRSPITCRPTKRIELAPETGLSASQNGSGMVTVLYVNIHILALFATLSSDIRPPSTCPPYPPLSLAEVMSPIQVASWNMNF